MVKMTRAQYAEVAAQLAGLDVGPTGVNGEAWLIPVNEYQPGAVLIACCDEDVDEGTGIMVLTDGTVSDSTCLPLSVRNAIDRLK